MDDHGHIPVLADQTLKLLEPRPGDVVVDCTVGRGGHAMLLAQAVAPGGRILGFDLDRGNLEHAARRLADGRGRTTATVDRGEHAGWSRPVPALAGYDALLGSGVTR